MVGLDDEIVAVSNNGVTIRMEVRGISSQGRDATGVRVMNIDDGDAVSSVAPILAVDGLISSRSGAASRPASPTVEVNRVREPG